jgi:hypothetical protein
VARIFDDLFPDPQKIVPDPEHGLAVASEQVRHGNVFSFLTIHSVTC